VMWGIFGVVSGLTSGIEWFIISSLIIYGIVYDFFCLSFMVVFGGS